MVKYLYKIIKNTNHELSKSIKKVYKSCMKPKTYPNYLMFLNKELIIVFTISKIIKKKSRTKLSRNEKILWQKTNQ